VHQRARAHRARFFRHVKIAIRQPPIAHRRFGLSESEHLRVRGRILQRLDLVMRATNDVAGAHHDGADRHFVRLESFPRQSQSFAHEISVALQINHCLHKKRDRFDPLTRFGKGMSNSPAKKEKFHWLRSWWPLLRDAYNDWSQDRALRFSAALAYYSIFSMAPLIIIAISAAGFFFGEQAARGQIFQQIETLLGPKAATEIQSIIQASSDKPKSTLATLIGLGTLVIGASGVFAQLKDALNTIWGVRLKKSAGIKTMIKDYAASFSIVIAIGFLLITSLLFSAVLQAISTYLKDVVPLPSFAAPLAELTTFALLTVLFALIYKMLPDVEIGWRDVWIGAVFTSIFFTIGKFLIGLYLGTSSVASGFGAAGALILILVWVYYSTTIFLFGAEFTKVYARKHGCGICPTKHSEVVTQEARREQGLSATERS
jgi:membrane protein